MTPTEKRQKRGNLVDQMRSLQKKADDEKRDMSAEESQTFDRMDSEQETLGKEIEAEEKRRAKLTDLDAVLAKTSDSGTRPAPAPSETRNEQPPLTAEIEKIGLKSPYREALLARSAALGASEYGLAFRAYVEGGLTAEVRSAISKATEKLAVDKRSMQADLLKKGGGLVAPTMWVARLIQALDDQVFVRMHATKIPVTMAEAVGAPSLDADLADADWTSELKTGNETDMDIGKRELRPHPLAKRVKVSNKLLRMSAIPADTLVRDRLAYKFGISEEKAFLTGDGAMKPLGVFTPTADGIPTSRDVPTGSATDLTADGLIDAKHSIKAGYWPRLRWLFHRDAIKRVRKLKTITDGQYVWQPGLAGGIPDRILETPYDISEYAPNTFTTGLYVGFIGDWSNYWIADALDLTIQVVDQLYAETNQTGFIGRKETDGAPVLAEAFARLKTGT